MLSVDIGLRVLLKRKQNNHKTGGFIAGNIGIKKATFSEEKIAFDLKKFLYLK